MGKYFQVDIFQLQSSYDIKLNEGAKYLISLSMFYIAYIGRFTLGRK